MINIVEGATTNFTTVLNLANRWTMRGRVALLGALGWMAHRAPIHISGANATFTFTDADEFVIDDFTHGATRTYTFAPPASDVPALYRFRIRSNIVPPSVDGPAGANDSFTHVGTILFKFAGANRAFLSYVGAAMNRNMPWTVDVEYDSTVAMLYAKAPVDGRLTIPVWVA